MVPTPREPPHSHPTTSPRRRPGARGLRFEVDREDRPAPPPPDVGAILHRLRVQRGLSLRELSDATGLSASFLSAVERGRSDIALGRLARVAAAFDHDIGSLLGYSARHGRPTYLTDRERFLVDRGDGIHYVVVQAPVMNGQLLAVTLEPRARFETDVSHSGVDITYVTSGRLTLLYDGEEHVLDAGEGVIYSGARPHRFANDTDLPAHFVGVVTEAVW